MNEHCGDCNIRCGTDEICVQEIPNVPTSSVCRPKPTTITCTNPGEVYCDKVGCVNLLTGSYNCGNCNTSCSSGEYCNNGTCVRNVVQPTTTPPPICTEEETFCNTTCVNLNTDLSNCGNCGKACPLGYNCYSRTCVPPNIPTVPVDKAVIQINDTGIITFINFNSPELTTIKTYACQLFAYAGTNILEQKYFYNISLTLIPGTTNTYYFTLINKDRTLYVLPTGTNNVTILIFNESGTTLFSQGDVTILCGDSTKTFCSNIGKCTNLSTDIYNCGQCGKPCFGLNEYCLTGQCRTPAIPKR